jgi:hypothetical protein
MRQMRADATLELQQEQRSELEKVARSRRTPQAVAHRARIVLMTAQGIPPPRAPLVSHSVCRNPRCASGVLDTLRTVCRGCATSLGRDTREHWTISAWPIC